MVRWMALLVLASLGMAQGWSEEAAKQLVQEGILYGYPDGSLRLNREVTRGEMAATLWRLILQYRLKDLRELTKEDIEALKGLLAAVELWRKEVQGAQEAAVGVGKELEDLRTKLGRMEAELSALAGQGVQEAQEALSSLKEVYARLSDLEGLLYKSLKDYREELNGLGGALRDVDGKLKAFEGAFAQAREEDRRLLEERWNGVTQSLSQLSARLGTLEALGAKVEAAERTLSSLSGRVEALEGGLKALREEVARLRREMPKVFRPQPFGVAVFLTGLDSGFATVEYTLPSGLSFRVLGALGGLGPYASLGVGYRAQGDGVGFRFGLGVGQGFYGPGFTYGEGSFGLQVDLIGPLALALEGVQSYPFGSGPIVSRFGLGVKYGW